MQVVLLYNYNYFNLSFSLIYNRINYHIVIFILWLLPYFVNTSVPIKYIVYYNIHKSIIPITIEGRSGHDRTLFGFIICNQCLSPLMLWVRIPPKLVLLNITLCDKVCQWLAADRWFSPGTPVSSTNKTNQIT
jgi:prolipoprotein diacylglyceryltransferase